MGRIVHQGAIIHTPTTPVAVYGNLEYRLAQPHHESDLRQMLRENTIPGWITLSYEREPNYFHATTIEGDNHETMIGIDRDSQHIMAVGSRSIQKRYVNGEPVNVGYLGQLRVNDAYRNKRRTLKYGFNFCKEHIHADGLSAYYLTSIIADNDRAKRLLTAGLPGFPTYRPIGALNTLAIPCRHAYNIKPHEGIAITRASSKHLDDIVTCLNNNNQRFQFASHWTKDDILSTTRCRGLTIDDFFVAIKQGKVVGCLAVWDQSAYKQVIVRHYRDPIRYARPLINILARGLGYPRLPKVNNQIRQVYVSHLSIDNDDPHIMTQLVKAALKQAANAGHKILLLGLADTHPLLPVVRKTFKHINYSSLIYLVHWEEAIDEISKIDNRTIHLDIAVL